MSYKFIDLFSGLGGFRIALESFGHKCVFSSEIETHARDIYNDNFGEYPSGDITKIKAEDIPEFDILAAGFPCQSMSIGGKKLGFEGKTGGLFFEILRIVDHHHPKLLLLENVKNINSVQNGKVLATILSKLEERDYQVYYKVLSGVNYGVPQCRERCYFVAYKKSIDIEFKFPNFSSGPIPIIEDIVDEEEPEQSLIVDLNKYPMTLVDTKNILNKPRKIATICKGRQGERIYSSEHPGITICTSGGGVGGKTGLYSIRGNVRKLTKSECRRMFGFPEDYVMDKSTTIIQSKFGNSVIVPVLKAIMQQVTKIGVLY